MRRIFWVRHGPTHEKAFVGWRDVPADLSDTARIARVAAALPDHATITSSDLKRASATATAIAAGRNRLPPLRSLREFDFGDWDGLHFSDVAKRDPELSRRFWEEPGTLRPPNGESWNDVAGRVNHAVDALLGNQAGDLIVVAHIGVIMTQIARTGCTAYQAMGHKIDNLSITLLQRDQDSWSLGYANHNP